MDRYLLPYGTSLEGDLIYSELYHPNQTLPLCKKSNPSLEDQIRIEIIGFPKFMKQWGPILRAAGARCVNRVGLFESGKVEAFLTHSNPTAGEIKKSSQLLDVPLFTKEWLLQCIITNKFLSSISD